MKPLRWSRHRGSKVPSSDRNGAGRATESVATDDIGRRVVGWVVPSFAQRLTVANLGFTHANAIADAQAALARGDLLEAVVARPADLPAATFRSHCEARESAEAVCHLAQP